MTKRRAYIGILLSDIFVFALLNSVIASAFYLFFQEKQAPYLTLVLAIPFFLMRFVRRNVNNFLVFLLSHIVLIFFPLFLPVHHLASLFAFLAMLIAGIYSTYVRIKGRWLIEKDVVIFAIALIAVIYGVLEYFSLSGVAALLTAWAFVIILCYIIQSQIYQLDFTLSLLSDTAGQPLPTILRFNNGILAAFLLPVILVAAVSLFKPLDQLLRLIGRGIYLAIRWFYSVLSALFMGDEPPPMEEVLPQDSPMQNPMEGLPPPTKAPRWLEILDTILYYLIHIILIAGLIALIVFLIYRLYKRFHAPMPEDDDIREDIDREVTRESIQDSLRNFWNRLPFFGRDQRAKIRRAYFRKVRQYIRKGVGIQKTDTTGEIKEKIKPDEDIALLTEQYNKARYGREENTE